MHKKSLSRFLVLALVAMVLMMLVGSVAGAPTAPTVTPGYSNLTEAAGVRYRGNSSGNEIYLGIPDLGVGGNRVEASYPNVYGTWQDGTYAVTFSYDAIENKIVTTIDDGDRDFKSLEYDFDDLLSPGCPVGEWNTMDINLVDRLSAGELAFNNVMLDSYSLGNFSDEGWKNWTVSNYDFSQGFTVSGEMVVQGWTGSETNKLQLMAGCVAPPPEPPIVSNVLADPNPVAAGTLFTLTADANDTANNITSAEYSINGGPSSPMNASDGAFDSLYEALTAQATAPIEAGLYDVCVTATNAVPLTSEPECIQLVVYDPSGGFVTGGGWITSPEGAMSIFGPVWTQDFEINDAGWSDYDDGWYGEIVVDDGTATFLGDSVSAPFSRFDTFRSTWNGTWIAEVDVYLDPSWPSGQGFDYSVAASGSDGNHQRDYIFHVGVVENYGPITAKSLLVNGSNNADFYTNPYKLVNDNGGDYYLVSTAGWYTLQHIFYDAGGYLAVDLNLLDAGGNVLWTATRENVADTIPGEVGGNRYSWFTHIDLEAGVQVDNHELFMTTASPEGKANFGFVSKYKKGASTPDGSTQFSFQAGDLNFHSTSYDWLVINQNASNAQFKGEGTVNGMGDYKFMLWAGDHDAGDTFRIKIWEEVNGGENVVYDNGADQLIGGGNIMVHKPSCNNCGNK